MCTPSSLAIPGICSHFPTLPRVSCAPGCTLQRPVVPLPSYSPLPLSAAPVRFLHELQAQEVAEGDTAHLRCELSRAGASLEWRKGALQLFPCAKYQMLQDGLTAELQVYRAEPEDSGDYTCDTGHVQSTAYLKVRGKLSVPSS